MFLLIFFCLKFKFLQKGIASFSIFTSSFPLPKLFQTAVKARVWRLSPVSLDGTEARDVAAMSAKSTQHQPTSNKFTDKATLARNVSRTTQKKDKKVDENPWLQPKLTKTDEEAMDAEREQKRLEMEQVEASKILFLGNCLEDN